MKNVLFIASEAVPFIKTGGLADVVGALPKYFNKDEFDVRVMIPKYTCIPWEYREKMVYKTHFISTLHGAHSMSVFLKWNIRVLHSISLITNFIFRDRSRTAGFMKTLKSLRSFSKAALSAIPTLGFRPDIIHCHDWQTGLVPVYLKERFAQGEFYQGVKSVMTIHNLKFQGIWDLKKVKDITGLPDSYFTSDKLEAYKDANYLKGGIVYADMVTTVSSTYAEEIKTPFYGEHLEGLMQARSNCLRGIVNGIDYEIYNPETDENLDAKYNQITFRKEKWKNKVALQKELGLAQDKGKFMIGIVSRPTDQKGFDLVAYVMEQLCTEDVQLVVLGTGDEKNENMFRHYDWKYHDRVSANIYYSEPMAHKIYAACDAF